MASICFLHFVQRMFYNIEHRILNQVRLLIISITFHFAQKTKEVFHKNCLIEFFLKSNCNCLKGNLITQT